jgi:hypothetical protein
MIKIHTHRFSFALEVLWQEREKKLFILFQNGKIFCYRISNALFNKLEKAKNKGNFIAQFIVRKQKSEFIRQIPSQELKQIIQEKRYGGFLGK